MATPLLAQLVLITGGLSLLSLLTLHFVSPEYQPSWRMISEYASGKHKWLITAFFLLWGASSLLLSLLLWSEVTTGWGKLGVALLLLSAVGACLGGLFDVKHRLHGLAFGVGVPSLPLAALLIASNLANVDGWSGQRSGMLLVSHAPWISLVLMAVAMAVMFAGFKKAGTAMGPDATPPEHVPEGVIAWGGYANRLLIICYVGWLLFMACAFLSIPRN